MITQEQLEDKIKTLFYVTFQKPEPKPLYEHPCDVELDKLTDDQIFALLAWELWKDGMDWRYVPDVVEGKHICFQTRELAVLALKTIFAY